MADLNTIAAELSQIGTHLGSIKDLLEQSRADSQALQQQAQDVLDAHAQSAQEYVAGLPEEASPDISPFETLPPGTQVRDYPGGARGFELSDGSLLRWNSDETMIFIGLDGVAQTLAIIGQLLSLPNGMTCALKLEQLQVTHQAAGIDGLPLGVEPLIIAANRYAMDLPEGERLIVDHAARTATLIDPSGTILVLAYRKAQGIGERIELLPISTTGDWTFTALASGHRGILRGDGRIDLMLAGGLDLTITFPAMDSGDGDDTQPSPHPCDTCGLEHR